jgi:hypothetical protein
MELVEELDAFAEVAPSSDGLSDQTKQYVSVELYDKFFMPIHEKIVTILNTKMHLVEGWEIPPSFSAIPSPLHRAKSRGCVEEGGGAEGGEGGGESDRLSPTVLLGCSQRLN